MPWFGLQCMIVVFPDHTRLLFYCIVHVHFTFSCIIKNVDTANTIEYVFSCADAENFVRGV